MKQNLIFALSLLLSTVATLNLTSCHDDYDDDDNHNPVVETVTTENAIETDDNTVDTAPAMFGSSSNNSSEHHTGFHQGQHQTKEGNNIIVK